MRYSALALLIFVPLAAQAQIAPEAPPPAYSYSPKAATLEQGMAAFNRGDYDTAVRTFYQLAPQGSPIAQFHLAYMLDNGLGTARDRYSAAEWYKKAADQDYLPAVAYLGALYNKGALGMQPNYKLAAKWYGRAAQLGDAGAQNAIGVLLRDGKGLKKDDILAAQWFLQSATQGNAAGMSNLGAMYRLGRGVKANPQEAFKWFTAAAQGGDLYALAALGDMYAKGEGVEKADPARGLAYHKQAAEKGYLYSQLALANAYENDEAKGPPEAAPWFAKAAKQGSAEAQTRIAFYYENGYGLPQDKKAALRWYQKVRGFYLPAQLGMARVYETGGEGVPADARHAFDLYTRCAQMGEPVCQRELSRYYREGKGTKASLVSAYEWMALAADAFPDGDDRDKAVVARVELSNTLTDEQTATARKWLDAWKPAKR